ncbi:uncharacterized protein LOC131029425 [Cryptomeria japonica]|uniref:uncharacterized protein LOC131029425 n=1 Tax=Cryptomeria japonica TaxID=3369 RepID=UPI0025AB6164|nr:uncharacterized protein LOC131029425 [Cryptomeria japonica]
MQDFNEICLPLKHLPQLLNELPADAETFCYVGGTSVAGQWLVEKKTGGGHWSSGLQVAAGEQAVARELSGAGRRRRPGLSAARELSSTRSRWRPGSRSVEGTVAAAVGGEEPGAAGSRWPDSGAIPRPTSDEIDIMDSNGSDRDMVTDYRDDEADGDGEDPNTREGDQDGDNEEDGEDEDEENEEEDRYENEEEDEEDKENEDDEEIEEAEEDESNTVLHHSGDDTIALDPSSLPSQAEKDPIRGCDFSPHQPMPTIQRQYKYGEPSGSQS